MEKRRIGPDANASRGWMACAYNEINFRPRRVAAHVVLWIEKIRKFGATASEVIAGQFVKSFLGISRSLRHHHYLRVEYSSTAL